jgi:regulator of RNase E activity RraA
MAALSALRAKGTVGTPIQLRDLTIHPGHIIVGDADGLVAIAPHAIHK